MSFNHCEPWRPGTRTALPIPLLPAARQSPPPRPVSLTTREREVLRRITDGQSTSQIAKELAIASSTARTHASNVLLKLGARTRIQAAAAASPPPPLIPERPESDPLAALTRREREVLAFMVEGQSQVAMAERLCVSPHTVRTHARNILSKLGVHSALEAAALVRRLMLAPLPDRRPNAPPEPS
jgi:DNA-binding NarL/FixJ family response regulator